MREREGERDLEREGERGRFSLRICSISSIFNNVADSRPEPHLRSEDVKEDPKATKRILVRKKATTREGEKVFLRQLPRPVR